MNMYFHKKGHVFVVQFFWNQLYDFMNCFDSFKKYVLYTLDYFSLQDSKWHLYSIQIILKYFYSFRKNMILSIGI
jgi:hypothetical protein